MTAIAGSRPRQNFVDKQLTNAQMLALRATPIALVPAPGAGLANIVDLVLLVHSGAAGAYTETADNLAIEYADGTDILTVETTGFLDQAAVETRTVRPAVSLTEPVANSAIRIQNNGDGEFGGGNAATTLSIRVYFTTVPVAAFGA